VSRVRSFPPLAGISCRLLVLGTMPGRESLRQRQYYAHPRNAFWPIMAPLAGVAADAPYGERTVALVAAGIAVWDVLRSCERPGSLDSDIDPATLRPNDFGRFFRRHPAIRTVCFNGSTAERLYRRHVAAQGHASPALRYLRLPGTSPANAALPLPAKRRAWHAAVRAALA
jgi:hypoxanthine-DNA glycosylase